MRSDLVEMVLSETFKSSDRETKHLFLSLALESHYLQFHQEGVPFGSWIYDRLADNLLNEAADEYERRLGWWPKNRKEANESRRA